MPITPERKREIALANLAKINNKGERNHKAKLSEAQVRRIKWRIRKGATDPELQEEFKMSRPAINKIRNGRSWKHVTISEPKPAPAKYRPIRDDRFPRLKVPT